MQKHIFLVSFIFLLIGLSLDAHGQSKTVQIDYSKRSNILDPDTLIVNSDNKLLFDHFVKLSSKEIKEMEAMTIKSEFAKLGLSPNERARFIKAYAFFVSTMEAHKISCEQWEEFKYLKPKDEK